MRVVVAHAKRCIPHAVPTLQQYGLRRSMDLAGETTEPAAGAPRFLPRECRSGQRVHLKVVSGYCRERPHVPRLMSGRERYVRESSMLTPEPSKLQCGYRCMYCRDVNA